MNTMFDALLVSWLLVAPPVQRPVLADYSLQQLQLQAGGTLDPVQHPAQQPVLGAGAGDDRG
mgnify:CR=1 FL=1